MTALSVITRRTFVDDSASTKLSERGCQSWPKFEVNGRLFSVDLPELSGGPTIVEGPVSVGIMDGRSSIGNGSDLTLSCEFI